MHYFILVTAVCLSVVLTSAFAETIPVDQLPQVNSFAIIDTEGEQYIAATNVDFFIATIMATTGMCTRSMACPQRWLLPHPRVQSMRSW